MWDSIVIGGYFFVVNPIQYQSHCRWQHPHASE